MTGGAVAEAIAVRPALGSSPSWRGAGELPSHCGDQARSVPMDPGRGCAAGHGESMAQERISISLAVSDRARRTMQPRRQDHVDQPRPPLHHAELTSTTKRQVSGYEPTFGHKQGFYLAIRSPPAQSRRRSWTGRTGSGRFPPLPHRLAVPAQDRARRDQAMTNKAIGGRRMRAANTAL